MIYNLIHFNYIKTFKSIEYNFKKGVFVVFCNQGHAGITMNGVSYLNILSNDTLPVCQHRQQIINKVKDSENLLIISETGSGKSTKIPQYLLSVLHDSERIICTQPRRIAAISLAKRVSQEIGCLPGEHVGYMVRFNSEIGVDTRLIYATDGSLLRESVNDPLLKKYSIIILDEAHERSLHTDILFGVVKKAQISRRGSKINPLKIVIMSATISVEKFSKYFDAQVFYIEGRTYPVSISYLKNDNRNYFSAAFWAVVKLHKIHSIDEDFLVFLAGQEEIEMLRAVLVEEFMDMDVECLYSALPIASQMNIFHKRYNCRKVIISTNIAETSITIPGVRVVIDSGVAKVKSLDSFTGLVSMKVEQISRSEARQRAGRVGRQCAGYCYRLYTESTYFNKLFEEPVPELLRSNLSQVLIMMLKSGITDPLNFNWIDLPDTRNIAIAWNELISLGAVDPSHNLTLNGKLIADLPLEPRFSRALIAAARVFHCSIEMVIIISILTEKSLIYNPRDNDLQKVQNNRSKFISEYGDIPTYFNIYREYKQVKEKFQDHKIENNQKDIQNWCTDHGVNIRAIRNINQIKKQLFSLMKVLGLPIVSAESHFHDLNIVNKQICMALFSGFFDCTAHYNPTNRDYKTMLYNESVHIHPSSFLHSTKHEYVFYIEKMFTTRNYVRHVSVFQKEWLESIDASDSIKTKILSCLNSLSQSSVVYS